MVYWRRSLNRRVNSLVWIIALATILTMTRAAWVALAVIVVFALVRDRSRAVQNIGVVIVSIVVVLGSLASGALNWLTPLTDRATSLFDLESGTGGFRARSWAMAFDDISAQNSLFTGLGVNTFEQRHADLVQAGLADYLSNAWIAQLYDVGLLGLCAVIVGLIFVWWSTRRRGDSIAFFVALAITTALTNSLWFAFGWVFMTLFDFRSRIVPNGGIDQKRPTQQDLVNGRVSAAASNRETTTGPTREPK
ncbi:O-antigen ligase [Glaciihabitans sp. dw_435]|uniref:O-antigen ligase family protein n=1 Tax=Glaciihabitans sp. dw_435 TaxID=2720081 RepID=UPI002106B875|nr:O-antigen ligase family protein [Glaciihabitans sp. dw_435]